MARPLSSVPAGSVIFFPIQSSFLSCGLSGFIAVKSKIPQDISTLSKNASTFITAAQSLFSADCGAIHEDQLKELLSFAQQLKTNASFTFLAKDHAFFTQITATLDDFQTLLGTLQHELHQVSGRVPIEVTKNLQEKVELVKDIDWCIRFEVLANIQKVATLGGFALPATITDNTISLYREINSVCNSLDRLEVRGRDSAGISILLSLPEGEYQTILSSFSPEETHTFQARQKGVVLENHTIRTMEECTDDGSIIHVTFTYKIASEIGSLGDNVAYLRAQIQNDILLQKISRAHFSDSSIQSHTRWASVGAITEANCHPSDQMTEGPSPFSEEIISACLNGDIDNYLELADILIAEGVEIPKATTSDTKIIPLWVARYRHLGFDVAESFRLAVNDFKGSHAISMQSSAAAGKLFLAQKGSGQAVFVGLTADGYMPSSEVYGFVEETNLYLKLDGESYVDTLTGPVQGQIFILDNHSAGSLSGVTAMAYDGSLIPLTPDDIRITQITSRDIDRQDFPHFFLKEISESPVSIEQTLLNRWKVNNTGHYIPFLEADAFPEAIRTAFINGEIRHIYFIGQGTAGVAGQVCADALQHYLGTSSISVKAVKSSEFSGFELPESDNPNRLADTLVIAITQSGTTTDTNRAIDMVRHLGAKTISIVNRRDSDITFKTDGVLYTSTGRDIEMSVASTKAFYSQITAGVLFALQVCHDCNCLSPHAISEDIQELLSLPDKMRKVISNHDVFQTSASMHALSRVHWAAVGSGPNKAAADEIRIKLSELCYKTISSDYVEDKKHIDLSSEPLILVCAMGTRETVMSDILKDVAIFKAHKAVPLVVAQEDDYRFSPYAADVFYCPGLPEHLAPILNTLCGHLWGYYAALTIHDVSNFFFEMREEISRFYTQYNQEGKDAYDLLLDPTFQGMIAKYYQAVRQRQKEKKIPLALGARDISEILLLFKYLSGRLPMEDFDTDFDIQGTAPNMIHSLFERLSKLISELARPIDAIKHQAKTVTVGTSRLAEPLGGLFLNLLQAYQLPPMQVSTKNILVLRQAEKIVAEIKGSILYKIEGLDVLGNPTDVTTISVVEKTGVSREYESRTETDHTLQGLKRIIAREKNIFIGYGRRLQENLIILPILSQPTGKSATVISNLLLLHVLIKEDIRVDDAQKALGGKLERIQNLLQEYSIPWNNPLFTKLPMADWFGLSAEKIADTIAQSINGNNSKSQK